MNRNQSIPTIELFMSVGILSLILIIGWRLYQDVRVTSMAFVPSSKYSTPAPKPYLETPLQSVQLSPKEYERIVSLEQRVVGLSAYQAVQKKRAERLHRLENEVAALLANTVLRQRNHQRILDLENEIANISGKQPLQKEYDSRLGELGRRLEQVETMLSTRGDSNHQGLRSAGYYEQLLSGNVVDSRFSNSGISELFLGAEAGSESGYLVNDQGDVIEKKGFFIPAGCFLYAKYVHNIGHRLEQLNVQYYKTEITSNSSPMTCVFVGPIVEKSTATNILQKLKKREISTANMVVKYRFVAHR